MSFVEICFELECLNDFGCVRGKEIGCIRQAQVIDVHWNCAVYFDSFEKVKAMMESLH